MGKQEKDGRYKGPNKRLVKEAAWYAYFVVGLVDGLDMNRWSEFSRGIEHAHDHDIQVLVRTINVVKKPSRSNGNSIASSGETKTSNTRNPISRTRYSEEFAMIPAYWSICTYLARAAS